MTLGSPLPSTLSETAARNERLIVLAALLLIGGAGLYLTIRTGDMLMGPGFGGLAFAGLLFVMWWTMMMAMMLPSAAPAILLYASMSRSFAAKGARPAPVAVFMLGYALIWTLFSALAVATQMAITQWFPLTGMYALTSAVAGGVLLTAAGLYQLTPLKQSCLNLCQSPLFFFARNWRPGAAGALRMGLRHGVFCLGCCWVLMALLFYGGVMEPRWIIGLALYVFAEKVVPPRWQASRFTGIALLAWGLWVIFRAFN